MEMGRCAQCCWHPSVTPTIFSTCLLYAFIPFRSYFFFCCYYQLSSLCCDFTLKCNLYNYALFNGILLHADTDTPHKSSSRASLLVTVNCANVHSDQNQSP